MGEKKVYKYPVIIEKAGGNFSAYSPDLPGCVATGRNILETMQQMRDAILFHIKGIQKEGLPIPEASTRVKYIEVTI